MSYLSKKRLEPKPLWWKNSFFWFAAILAVIGLIGLFAGDAAIRDPGQIREGGLVFMYFIGAVVMFVNGLITHRLNEKRYNELPAEERQESAPKEDQATASSQSTSA